MSFISAGGDLTPNGIELVGDDLTCVDFARRRLRGRRFDPDSIKSIGLLFLLHNAGSVSVLTDPQLINGQDRLLWSW